MAVAAHVSRVGKDYAPHGYSIMESISASCTVAAGDTTAFYVPVFDADDVDVYVESASFVAITAHGSEAANYWTITLVSAPAGIGSDEAISSTSVGGASTVVARNSKTSFTIAKPIVAKDRAVYLKCLPNHASSIAQIVSVVVRIRRKA